MNKLVSSFLFIGVLITTYAGQAQERKRNEKVAPSKPLIEKWYKPYYDPAANKKKPVIVISGQARPGLVIDRPNANIKFIRNKKVRELSWKKVSVSEFPVTVRDDGYFEIRLRLPNGVVQIPLDQTLEGRKQNIVIALSVDKKNIAMASKKPIEESPFVNSPRVVWGGLGYNYVRYEQSGVYFESFKGPAFLLKGQYEFSPIWTFQSNLKSSPGSTVSSDKLTVQEGDYNWITFTADAIQMPEKWNGRLFGQNWKYGLRYGIQYHIVPFLVEVATDTYSVTTNTLTMATLGGHVEVNRDRRIYYEGYLEYQYPLMSGSKFKIQPTFAFDGSVGMIYRYKAHWRLGLFWYGQWHQYDYTSDDGEGSQTLFYSNIEARVGFDF